MTPRRSADHRLAPWGQAGPHPSPKALPCDASPGRAEAGGGARAGSRMFHVHQTWYVNICSPFLLGQCPLGPRCPRHHTQYPYHWQLLRRRVNEWVSVPETAQHQLERLYCTWVGQFQLGPSTSFQGDQGVLDFNGCRVDSLEYERWRRLSTTDAAEQNPHLFTRWKTFREVDGQWREYEEPLAAEIEASYKRRQNRFHFAAEGADFVLNWISLSESNLATGGYRKICRRPAFRSLLEILPHLKTLPTVELPREPVHHLSGLGPAASGVDFPPSWVPFSQKQGFAQVPLSPLEPEYQMVYGAFHETVMETRFIITHISRIQNRALWERFARCQALLRAKLGDGPPSRARHLFHGTSEDSARAICRANFDPSLSGKHGARYGRGSCFATTAGYSHAFALRARRAPGSRCMFLAKVLTGRSTRGLSVDRRPPPLDSGPGDRPGVERYDSCVNCVFNPTIYVLYDSSQCYPYWLIEYQTVSLVAVD
ncbi:protein mono-ADP-ribosyltransferase TIPARP-like [Heptranchias perlo]|uniref:protein mono-ADP-ribosyltransferase TIPARP-like n=1 Tax=Heptranchias perlo TaxID=212740 RepID=UPI00355AC8D9